MAKKTSPEKPKRELTRRQRSHWKQQQRRNRLIMWVAILVVVAVLSVIGVGVYNGWYVSDYKPMHETIIEVNGIEFDMEYCIDSVTYQLGDYTYLVEYYFDYIIEGIEQYELIRQEAEEMGYTVSEEEITTVIESYGYTDIPAIRDAVRVSLLLTEMSEDYFDELVPTSADQSYVMAMFLESKALAEEVVARIEAGEYFGTLAAELSLDDVSQAAAGALGWMSPDILPLVIDSTVLEENVFSSEVGVVSQPLYEEDRTKAVGYWLIEVLDVDDTADPVVADVRVILLDNEHLANDIRIRLEAGEDFAELATAYSLHDESSEYGGEYEAAQGDGTTAFEDYVFGSAVELETLSQPIRDEEITTDGGYWLILVPFSEEDREIDSDSRDLLKEEIMNDWVLGLWDDPDNEVVSYLDEENRAWAISYITGG